MSVSLVQSSSRASGNFSSGGTVSFSSNPTAGNTLILVEDNNAAGSNPITSVTGGGVTWVKAISVATSSGGNGTIDLWYGLGTTGGASAKTVTVTMGTTSTCWCVLTEWSGVGAPSQIVPLLDNAGSGGFNYSPTILPTDTGQLLIGGIVGQTAILTTSANSPFSAYPNLWDNTTNSWGAAAYYIDALSAAESVYTYWTSGHNCSSFLVAFNKSQTSVTPEQFGAARDGSTDDTGAIKAAIASAVTAAQNNGTYYAEVVFSPGVYSVTGSLDTSQKGRAQIPLPYITGTPQASVGQKVILALRGIEDAGDLALWYQGSAQKAGPVLLSNLSTAYDMTHGAASVIGGPTPESVTSGYPDGFSNMLAIVDGLSVVSTATDPHHIALDLSCVAQARVKSFSCSGDVAPHSFSTLPSSGGAGLRMPQVGNNDYSKIDRYACEGYTYGLIPSEHMQADNVALIYCGTGIDLTNTADTMHISYLSTEACGDHISIDNPGGGLTTGINIAVWDIEDGTSGLATVHHLKDANNLAHGTFGFQLNPAGSTPTVSGGANVKLVSLYQGTGHVTAPTVPATTVALTNPFWRDAAVTVTGGTVTVIAVDGTATGLTSGTVIVPSGKSITLTYSAAPSWNWVLL